MPTIFDREHFHHMTAGDAALQTEVIALFRAQISALSEALRGADWRGPAHTLKGSARGIGLAALAAACERAEAEGGGAALEDVHAEIARAMTALDATFG